MESPDLTLLFHWLDLSAQLVQRVCVVVAGAFACIRLQWVRRALRGLETSWKHRLTMMLAFGGLGILGTHSGILVDVEKTVHIADWSAGALLNEHQAIVGFRDTMVLVGGLIGGPWVGLGAGLVAGFERYLLGGFAALGSGVSTLVLGILAGLARRFRPERAVTPVGAFTVALMGTLLHRVLLLFLASPYPLALALTWDIVIPVIVVNCLGCVLFIWVARDLDRDRLESEARAAEWREQQAQQGEQEARLLQQAAELRALRAQVEPHFLNNTLNAIRALIRRDPDKARAYVVKLADFFETTRKSASANTIPLREELAQLDRYLDFQRLRFAGKFRYDADEIPAVLLDCRLPPHSLLIVAENALTHGMPGRAEGFAIRVGAVDLGDRLALRLADNGSGMAPERLAKLGKGPVESFRGNGSALHQLAQSLQLAFRGHADLSIASEQGAGTEVVLTLPKKR